MPVDSRADLIGSGRLFLAAAVVASVAAPAWSQDAVGLEALTARLGTGAPTGAGVGVCQVEATPDGTTTTYGPDTANAAFAGKTFTPMSGTPSVSWHATTVGFSLYGSGTSIAPGISSIFTYEVNSWINSFLRYNQGTLTPVTPPGSARVMNHSWIGSAGASVDNQVLRRLDFQVNRDDTVHVVGLNNGVTGVVPALLACSYNTLSVGRTDGQHSYGLTTGTDGAGRMKPEIVAPGDATSWATPVVGAAAALMQQVAAQPPLDTNANAREATVIKAVLMAGARHEPTWSNQPTASGASRGETARPLDPIFGAGVVNVDRAHRILTGGEQEGSAGLPPAPDLRAASWDYQSFPAGGVYHWRFRVEEATPELSVVATWHRTPSVNFASVPTHSAISLRLFRLDGGTLVPLVGEDGAAYYASGNVASTSQVDNVQHLHVRGLQAGEYVIQAIRPSLIGLPAPFAIAWLRTPARADTNWDGKVDGLDLAVVLSAWGTSGSAGADLTGDGNVDGLDLAVVLASWS